MAEKVLTRSERAISGSCASILKAVRDPQTELAIWQRPLPDGFEPVYRAKGEALANIDCEISAGISTDELAGMFTAYGHGQCAQPLASEIAMLCALFSAIAGVDRLRLRLEIVTTDACRKFHADFVTMRLLTTFSGQGTQWIDTDAEENIHQLRAGDVAIFKGKLSIEEPRILHRSPPIGGSGETRLLLAIDPLQAGGE